MVTVIHHYHRSGWGPEKLDGYFKYRQQAYQCSGKKDRLGHPFSMLMTFDEWWGMWQDSGHWHKRGRHIGQYGMMRHGNVGSYTLDNVLILPRLKASRVTTARGCNLMAICPRCGTPGNLPALKRWHFDNCQA